MWVRTRAQVCMCVRVRARVLAPARSCVRLLVCSRDGAHGTRAYVSAARACMSAHSDGAPLTNGGAARGPRQGSQAQCQSGRLRIAAVGAY